MSCLCHSERELQARLNLLRIETGQALDKHWNLVEAVAQALLQRKTMIGWEIETIIGAAYTPDQDRIEA